jgi:hypothetical protein
MKRILCLTAALLMVSTGAAFARHGKAGLWDVSTTMNMAITMPPEALAQMKKAGVSMPTAQTFKSQTCMTQAEVESDKPPQMSRNDMGCETHVTSQTATSMTAEMVCKSGEMQGTGHVQIAYDGAEHYSGSYEFKGNVQGNTSSMSSSFRGDWVKADCGSVKPFTVK